MLFHLFADDPKSCVASAVGNKVDAVMFDPRIVLVNVAPESDVVRTAPSALSCKISLSQVAELGFIIKSAMYYYPLGLSSFTFFNFAAISTENAPA